MADEYGLFKKGSTGPQGEGDAPMRQGVHEAHQRAFQNIGFQKLDRKGQAKVLGALDERFGAVSFDKQTKYLSANVRAGLVYPDKDDLMGRELYAGKRGMGRFLGGLTGFGGNVIEHLGAERLGQWLQTKSQQAASLPQLEDPNTQEILTDVAGEVGPFLATAPRALAGIGGAYAKWAGKAIGPGAVRPAQLAAEMGALGGYGAVSASGLGAEGTDVGKAGLTMAALPAGMRALSRINRPMRAVLGGAGFGGLAAQHAETPQELMAHTAIGAGMLAHRPTLGRVPTPPSQTVKPGRTLAIEAPLTETRWDPVTGQPLGARGRPPPTHPETAPSYDQPTGTVRMPPSFMNLGRPQIPAEASQPPGPRAPSATQGMTRVGEGHFQMGEYQIRATGEGGWTVQDGQTGVEHRVGSLMAARQWVTRRPPATEGEVPRPGQRDVEPLPGSRDPADTAEDPRSMEDRTPDRNRAEGIIGELLERFMAGEQVNGSEVMARYGIDGQSATDLMARAHRIAQSRSGEMLPGQTWSAARGLEVPAASAQQQAGGVGTPPQYTEGQIEDTLRQMRLGQISSARDVEDYFGASPRLATAIYEQAVTRDSAEDAELTSLVAQGRAREVARLIADEGPQDHQMISRRYNVPRSEAQTIQRAAWRLRGDAGDAPAPGDGPEPTGPSETEYHVRDSELTVVDAGTITATERRQTMLQEIRNSLDAAQDIDRHEISQVYGIDTGAAAELLATVRVERDASAEDRYFQAGEPPPEPRGPTGTMPREARSPEEAVTPFEQIRDSRIGADGEGEGAIFANNYFEVWQTVGDNWQVTRRVDGARILEDATRSEAFAAAGTDASAAPRAQRGDAPEPRLERWGGLTRVNANEYRIPDGTLRVMRSSVQARWEIYRESDGASTGDSFDTLADVVHNLREHGYLPGGGGAPLGQLAFENRQALGAAAGSLGTPVQLSETAADMLAYEREHDEVAQEGETPVLNARRQRARELRQLYDSGGRLDWDLPRIAEHFQVSEAEALQIHRQATRATQNQASRDAYQLEAEDAPQTATQMVDSALGDFEPEAQRPAQAEPYQGTSAVVPATIPMGPGARTRPTGRPPIPLGPGGDGGGRGRPPGDEGAKKPHKSEDGPWRPHYQGPAEFLDVSKPPPKHVIRVADILVPLFRGIGATYSQGAIRSSAKHARAQGLAGPGERVQLANWDDLQNATHEILHNLSQRYPTHDRRWRAYNDLPSGPGDPPWVQQFRNYSYDQNLVTEGAAEFFRAFMTGAPSYIPNPDGTSTEIRPTESGKPGESMAQDAAQEMSDFIEALPKPIKKALHKAKKEIRAYYAQGPQGTLKSKIGFGDYSSEGREVMLPPETRIGSSSVGRIAEYLAGRFRQGIVDDMHGGYRLSRAVGTADAPGVDARIALRNLRGVPHAGEALWIGGYPRLVGKVDPQRPSQIETEVVGPGLGWIIAEASENAEMQEQFGLAGISIMMRELHFQKFKKGPKKGERRDVGQAGLHDLSPSELAVGDHLLAKYPHFQEVMEKLNTFNRGSLQYAVDTGLISQAQVDTFERAHHFWGLYRAFKGIGSDPNFVSSNRGFMDKTMSATFLRTQGSTRPHMSPIEAIMYGNHLLFQLSEENLAKRHVFAELDTDKGARFGGKVLPGTAQHKVVWEHILDHIIKAAVEAKQIKAADVPTTTKEKEALVLTEPFQGMPPEVLFEYTGGQLPRTIDDKGQIFSARYPATKEEPFGRVEFREIGDPLLIRSMSRIRRPVDPPLLRFLNAFRALRQAFVQYHLDFFFGQALRDAPIAGTLSPLNLGEEFGEGVAGQTKAYMTFVAKAYGQMAHDLTKGLVREAKGKAASPEHLKSLINLGGGAEMRFQNTFQEGHILGIEKFPIIGKYMGDPGVWTEVLRGHTDRGRAAIRLRQATKARINPGFMYRDGTKGVMSPAKWAWYVAGGTARDIIQLNRLVGKAVEQGPRMAARQAALDQGLSIREAEFIKAESGGDFRMKGDHWLANAAVKTTEFLNPAFVAAERTYRAGFEDTKYGKGQQWAFRFKFMTMALAHTIPFWLYRDEEWFQKIPWHVRRQYTHVLRPQDIGDGKKPINFVLPRFFEAGMAGAAIEFTFEMLLNDTDETLVDWGKGMGAIIMDMFRIGLPGPLDLYVEQHSNKLFFPKGQPIEPLSQLGEPNYLRTKPSTPRSVQEFYRWLSAQGIEPDWPFPPSPARMDALGRGLFANYYPDLMAITDMFFFRGKMSEKDWTKFPGVRRMFKREGEANKFRGIFHEAHHEARELAEKFGIHEADNDELSKQILDHYYESVEEWRADNASRMSRIARKARERTKEMDEIERDDDSGYTPLEKYQLKQELRDENDQDFEEEMLDQWAEQDELFPGTRKMHQ